MKIIITFLYALASYWLVLPGMSQMKWLLGETEWWNRKLGSDRIPPPISLQGICRRQWTASPLISPSLPQDCCSLSQSASVSQSCSLLGPIQHRPSLRTLLAPVSVSREGWQSSWTSPGSCWKPPLLPSWEALARAISLYCPCLNGDSDGFQAGRTSLLKILHRYEMQLFGDIRKQKEIKDSKGCENLMSPWGGSSHRASTRQGRSWHSERPREEKGFNLLRTPAKSIVSSATQLLFPGHQLEWPSSNRKLHLVWGRTSAY